MSESKDPGTGSGENSVTIKLLCDRPLIWKAEGSQIDIITHSFSNSIGWKTP